jgi:hypothetical protein
VAVKRLYMYVAGIPEGCGVQYLVKELCG